jgi:hypothetical protein
MKNAIAVAIASCSLCTFASAADYAGVTKTVRGTATANRSATEVVLQPGTRLEEGDVIKTGPDGYLGLTLRDDTLLTLGPRTTFTLEKYAFDPKTHDGNFAASITRGVVHVVTGLIPKKSPDAFVVKTGISTMGVRGTEFIVEVE